MSDDESFVILGSSPLSSLENDYIDSSNSSLESDIPYSQCASLQNSQNVVKDNIQSGIMKASINSQTSQTQNPFVNNVIIRYNESNVTYTDSEEEVQNEIQHSIGEQQKVKQTESLPSSKDNGILTDSKILETSNPFVNVNKGDLKTDKEDSDTQLYSFEDFALKNSLQQQQNAKKNITPPSSLNSEKFSKPKTTQNSSANNDLAAGLIMGDIDLDVLKTSVYSQFPSISMEARPEELMKLQSMVTEYNELKHAIRMANCTMKLFYDNSLQWKDKMKATEEEYKKQLESCKNEIEELRKRNNETEINFKAQIEAIEIARKKDREEQIQIISEKEAVLQNMRAQIVKLESKQASFDYLELSDSQINYTRSKSHDVQKEINWLKGKLTSAEEIVNKSRAEIIELTKRNKDNDDKIVTLEATVRSMASAYEEQEERIVLLETQNKVHCKDFEMEKESRELAVKEKQQVLHDLRLLQKRNQQLIEEHQKLADNLQKKLSLANEDEENTSFEAAAHADFNNLKRPTRVLPSSSTSATANHICPICNKAFKTLSILLSHANDCVGTI